MNNRRTKNFFRILLTQFTVGFVMFSLGLIITIYAQGYRFNFHNFKFIKTGILAVTALPKTADVYLNGRLVAQKTPYYKNLSPGYYKLEIKKPGYQDWSLNGHVEAEMVTDNKYVTLFKANPTVTELTDTKKIALISQPIDLLAGRTDRELVYSDHEIWVGETLVMRLSNEIARASWYPDLEHIAYQDDNEIRIIEKNGLNDTLLVKLTVNTQAPFAFNSKGDELYFLDGSQYKVAQIK